MAVTDTASAANIDPASRLVSVLISLVAIGICCGKKSEIVAAHPWNR